jgi:hypothetical protein
VLKRFVTALSRLQGNFEPFLEDLLASELVKGRGTKLLVKGEIFLGQGLVDKTRGHNYLKNLDST